MELFDLFLKLFGLPFCPIFTWVLYELCTTVKFGFCLLTDRIQDCIYAYSVRSFCLVEFLCTMLLSDA